MAYITSVTDPKSPDFIPVAAFGNSDGDFEMMEYIEANKKYNILLQIKKRIEK